MSSLVTEVDDSNTLFQDTQFMESNKDLTVEWTSIKTLYPAGVNEPLLPEVFSREQLGQGNHYECFMISALAALVRFPDVIRNCFVTKKVRQDGRYTFQFFRGREWVKVEIDDRIAMENGCVLYTQSPTGHWWPLLLEKAYAKFYTSYDHLDGCTLLETFHDLTGNPVLNIPMDAKLAKALGVDTTNVAYWRSLADGLQRGAHVLSSLTKDANLERLGMQSEQQYSILGIFSLTGDWSLDDVVVHLYNPFEDEEYQYKGPLNKEDAKWTDKLRQQYPVDDRSSIFFPLKYFLKHMNSIQYCFMNTIGSLAQVFSSEWKGESAGGNPTYVTWRKNPLFLVQNKGSTDIEIVTMLQQEDQRRSFDLEEGLSYIQSGVVVTRLNYQHAIPTFWVTGNSHKTVFKGLFLNSREVTNKVTIPANSLCYLVPCTVKRETEARFQLSLYHLKNHDYSELSVEPLSIPSMNWASPARKDVMLCQKEKERVDFYVDEGTDIHIIMHQTKPYVSKCGGDAMTEDYMGMYLYDDTDRKIAGVHAATNFREISIIHRLPRSGRYALSVTCPRAKGEVPAYVTVVGSHASNVRIVDTPEDATMFDDEDIIDEGEDAAEVQNPIDYTPVVLDVAHHSEQAESDSPFEDKRFYIDNRGATSDPWVHIGDLYPEGKTRPLLPDELNRDQFGQGDRNDCSTLTAFAALLEHHPDVIRNCFISKKPRKDGRYTFQFHRYGQWVKVEIDDRIPMVKDETVFCRSPTRHWWPLLLEKAYAKFYTLYQNLEEISQGEVFHDFTGRPCIAVSTDPAAAKVNMSYFDEVHYWTELTGKLPHLCTTALAGGREAEQYGLLKGRSYAVLGILPINDGQMVCDRLVKMYNPYENSPYTGPMNAKDAAWTSELLSRFQPKDDSHAFYIPADKFLAAFSAVQMGFVGGLAEPSHHFNSEWGKDTNGGDTSLVSWRKNPLYVVSNPSDHIVEVIVMVRQPDQRYLLHTMPNRELGYPMKGISVAQASSNAAAITTHLVTFDNHRLIHRGTLAPLREVANVVMIPPHSLCYLVGHCKNHAIGKFMLSYWFMRGEDSEKLRIERYCAKVADDQPAIGQVDFDTQTNARVDFVIDTPSDVHAVLRQQKAFDSPEGGDVIAKDYVGVYLYDMRNNLIKGIPSAMNYRELSLVTRLGQPGRYVFFTTCPRGRGSIPCNVEICAVGEAHVRITETPEDASPLTAPDMSFLDQYPEGIPLSELPLDIDLEFQDHLTELQRLLNDAPASANEIHHIKNCLNERAHDLAKALLATDRPIYLADHNLKLLNPLLNDDQEYMDAERERYYLKQDLRNHYKLPAQEDKLRAIANQIADQLGQLDLTFIDERPEGIPRDEIPMMSNKAFADMAIELLRLRRRPEPSTSSITQVEDCLNNKAKEMARAIHDAERQYLDPAPAGIPLELLPLNTDGPFCSNEDQLRNLLRSSPADNGAITALQIKLSEQAHQIAVDLKEGERGKLLAKSYEGVPTSELPLDTDAAFHEMEVERLRRLRTGTDADAKEAARLGEELRKRARDLAVAMKASERAVLQSMDTPLTAEQLSALLDSDAEVADMERRLRELRKNPEKNAALIKALEEEMQERVKSLADRRVAEQRSKCLAADYGGRPTGTLPLSEDAEYRDAEAAYMKMLDSGDADPAALRKLLDTMNERASAIAESMNAAERETYLPKAVHGVPLRALPLDEDAEFRRLEQERARAVCTPGNGSKVAALEAQLLARAGELARSRLAGDRAYLAPEPAGIPLELLPIDEDAEFCAKEAQRAELKESGSGDPKSIALKETELNARAVKIAEQLKDGERGKFLAESYEGIPMSELSLDTDAAFHEMEVERLRRMHTGTGADAKEAARLGEELRKRARDLAVAMKASERAVLQSMDTPLTAEQLSALLDSDAEVADMERRLRELRKNPEKNADAIKALEEEMQERVKSLADRRVAEQRSKCLAADYGGRPTGTLPLSEDAEYRDAEAAYMKMLDSGNADPVALRKLLDKMNERASAIAESMNVAERETYLPKAVHGVPLRALPLDEDAEFRRLEQERARAVCTPGNGSKVVALEAQLLARAGELARSRLAGDRAYLAPEPAGIPLELLPIDEDAEFCAKEAQRAELKESGSGDPNSIALKETELNARAVEIAEQLKDGERGKFLAESYEGVPMSELPLDTDAAFHEMEVERLRRMRTGTGADAKEAARLGEELRKRARDLAVAMKASERAVLQSMDTPLTAEQLSALLDSDAEVADMERRLRELRKNPEKNADAIKALEEEMQKRVKSLADRRVAEQRSKCLAADYGGRPTGTLPLSEDAEYRDAEAAYMKMLDSGNADPVALRKLLDKMNERASAIAESMNAAERETYLPKAVHGVPLRALPLDEDAEFRRLEQERARAVCTPGNGSKVAALEAQLLARAGELARSRLAGDRAYLAPEPAGIPLELLPIDEDAEFCAKEAQRAELKESGSGDPKSIALKETELNARAVEIAEQLKDGERGKFLAELYEGVLTSELPLDTDAAFHEMEVERLRRMRTGTGADAKEAARLGEELRKRARDLAVAMKASERAVLQSMDTPLTAEQLSALLDSDAEVADMERRLRELRKNPEKNADAIKALEEEMQKRVKSLADRRVAEQRSKCLAADYGGRPTGTLPLSEDAEYRDAEAAYMKMLDSGNADPVALRKLLDKMNERASAIAESMNAAERETYLPKAVHGVPLRALPLDEDAEFRRLEQERARAVCTPGNGSKVAALEAQLLARAGELARSRLAADRAYLAPEPAGIPLELLPIDEDAEFCAKEAQRAELKESGSGDPKSIALKETELNARAVEIAEQLKDGERGKFLAELYEGVLTSELPLDTDAAFHEMEVERLRRMRTGTGADAKEAARLGEELRKRARDLAVAMKASERAVLQSMDTPLTAEQLSALLDSDAEVADMERRLRELRKNPEKNADAIKALEEEMQERVKSLADRRVAEQRSKCLAADYGGRPTGTLPLSEDAEYRDAEAAYMKMLDSGNADPVALRKLLDKMNERASAIAESMNAAERETYLPKAVHGVPLRALPLDEDAEFRRLEQERARAVCTPGNGSKVAALEAQLLARAGELARSRLAGDRAYLAPEPAGIPLELLPIDEDAEFCAKEAQRAELKESGSGDPNSIALKETELNARAVEIAEQLKDGERGKVLAELYEGVLTSELPLDTDAAFHEMEVERLRRMRTGTGADAKEAARLGEELRKRARDLAVAMKASERAVLQSMDTPLTAEQLSALLDSDAEVADMERRLRELRKNPEKNAALIKALEEEMQERVKSLADRRVAEQRSKCLAADYGGRPTGTLPLSEDAEYRDAEAAYMKMLDSGNADPVALRKLLDKMNERASAIAESMNAAERETYLPKAVHGVPLRALPLDEDAEFRRLEQERARAVCTPGNGSKVAALEAQLLARAGELARSRLAGDRAYLAPEPAGIPLELLPIDEDAEFCAKEAQRAELKESGSGDPKSIALKETELNARAVEIAEQLKDGERGKVLAELYEGVLTSELPLDTDAAFHEMEVERLRRMRTGTGADAKEAARLGEELRKRARDLAVAMKASERAVLQSMDTPLTAEQLSALLDSDAEVADMERRLRELRKNPEKNADAIKALEEEMQKRVKSLADRRVAEQRSKCLAAEYGGRPTETLPLSEDAEYRDAEAAYMKMLETGNPEVGTLQWLLDTMNERASAIAESMNAAEREMYLPKAVHGVPLRALPLDEDAEFRRLEQERARAVCTPGNGSKVAALEAQLLARAGELARSRLAGDRAYLAPEPAGIPLELLPIDEDAEFCAKEAQRAELKESGSGDPNSIALKETELNARAVEIAEQLKDGERGKVLAELYEGVLTSELPLDTDAAFHEMEVERLRRMRTGTGADAKEAARLGEELRKRARDLAVAMKASERAVLQSMDTPLTAEQLSALLDSDAEVADMERRLRELRKNPEKNAALIKALEEEMQERVKSLADRRVAEQRSKCLAADYGGRPTGTLPLSEDAEYRDAEAAYMKMLDSGNADPAALRKLLDKMNERASAIAESMNAAERETYLPKAVHGVPLRALPLDEDAEFRRLEQERARAVCTPGNGSEVAALEAQLLARAGELARSRLAGDRAYLAPEPAGIPLELLPIDEDAEFCAKEAQRAELKESGSYDLKSIALKETELNARAVEIAEQLKDGERGKFLAESYEGVPTSELPLDTDAAFHEMEIERLKARAVGTECVGGKSGNLDLALNRRALELAREKRTEDISSVDVSASGLSREMLDLHNDAIASALIEELRSLRKSPHANAAVLREKEEALNMRALELASRLLSGDRAKYLDHRPGNILLEHIPLDKDDVYHALEVERCMIKATQPVNSETAMGRVEKMLKDRACQLAKLVMKEDLDHFSPTYHGISTTELKPHSDRLFNEAAEKRRIAMHEGNVKLKEEMEQIMDMRLNELAREQEEGELYFLVPNPEGLPLSELPLSTDKVFNELKQGREKLKESDPMGNRKEIALVEEEMNHRVVELARSMLKNDFESLDKHPSGIPLDLLKPREDAEVARLIEELRQSKRSLHLKDRVPELEAKLNKRVMELAKAALEEGRSAYLDPCPQGVPLEILPLHTDAFFEKEVQRAILRLQDPAKNADAIGLLENELNSCVHELALAQKEEDLRGLDQHPRGLPLTLVKPHQDDQIGKLIDELRKLKASKGNQDSSVREIQNRINERCYEIVDSLVKDDRSYLPSKVEHVPLRRLPLDTDAEFHALEVERAKLKLIDPKKHEHRIATVEEQLKSRAVELGRVVKTEDLKLLSPTARDIPLELLNLHEDPTFNSLVAEKEQLLEGHGGNSAATLLNSMNECAIKLADKLLRGDRGYLNQEPGGLPLEQLPLDTDTDFHKMEAERAVLKLRDPVNNASAIQSLEDKLKKRTHDLANVTLAMDRGYLDLRLEGVSIEELPLSTDSEFHSMEVERAKLKASGTGGNMQRVKELEDLLNQQAANLAEKQFEEDLKGLDQEPEGYPLNLLNPHKDAVFAAEVTSLRRAKREPQVSARKVQDAQEALNVRLYVLARERIAADRARMDQEPENMPLALLPLEEDALFAAAEKELRLLKAGDKQSPKAIAEAERQMNDRAHAMATKMKAEGRKFLSIKSSDIPRELLALDTDKTFLAKEKELWKLKLQPHALDTSKAAADLRLELQARADELGEAQLKGDREKYLDMQPQGVDLCDIPLDTDHAYHEMEVKRAILLAQDATDANHSVEELEKQLNARANQLAREIVMGDRDYLPEAVNGIPMDELPLDTDRKFMKLERQRRLHKRSPDMKKEVASDEEELRNHVVKLASELITMDLEPLKASYRGIAKEELDLHTDAVFRELAKKRRAQRCRGRVQAVDMAAIEDEMDRRASEIADDVINTERAFLDREPEGMHLIDVPLDDDPSFQKLEQEHRRRLRDPRSAKQNGDVLRELAEKMNERCHTLARAAFAKVRGFMAHEYEGIPLAELGLDEDPEFKEAEIMRYRMKRGGNANAEAVKEMELRMNERAKELARAILAADRFFLDAVPEGVLLEELPLDSDKEFGDLARERRRRKKMLTEGVGESEVRAIEKKMNARAHELAKEFLEAERAFLSREPEGVPLADLPLNTDSLFRAMEDERLQLKRMPFANPSLIAAKEMDLEDRAHMIAKELLRQERSFLDPEPLGVPLEELPLNDDHILNPVERKRRALRVNPKGNHEGIRACEERMAERVSQIAENFVEKERAFLDQNPEGVPLRYLPLNTDREFHEKELYRRKLLHRNDKNRSEIADTERKMNERVHVLAKDLILKGRAFLHPEPCGLPIADVPLNEDEDFRKMEEQRRALKEAGRNHAAVKMIEEKLNDRAEELAQGLLDDERAFMDTAPLGISLCDLPLNTDRRMREIERTRRHLRKTDPEGGASDIAVLEAGMNSRAYELAEQMLRNDRDYLHPEPCGVPLLDLPLLTDSIFHEKELARFRAKKNGQTDLLRMEEELNERLTELALAFIEAERAYLDQEPEGVPLNRLPLDTDPIFHNMELDRRRLMRSGEHPSQVLELEHLLNHRAHELSLELRGWQDEEFRAKSENVADQWVRVCDLYPEGRYEPFVPAVPALDDVLSGPQDISYFAPFITALSRHPVLLQRLIVTRETPVNAPYRFTFFDPHGNPVDIEIDDRVPCDDKGVPKFAQSPYHRWYPLLLEKAYAKFVGGYDQLINCTALETLRDLTGRPVTHVPFDEALAEAAELSDFMSVDFWQGVKDGMVRGDVVVCSSNSEVPDGIHPLCSYALIDVVFTLEGSTNLSDIVIKLQDSYQNEEPFYTGPLCHTDTKWSAPLQRVCQYHPDQMDVLYLPLPTFLRNFASMQTCHINCGDRVTVTGTWDSRTSGGNANFTTFRNNPIFVLQNNGSRSATLLAELRHTAAQFVDPEGRNHYPQTGIVLMEPTSSSGPLTPLITNSTARFLHKGMMLDSREVCTLMEVPAYSTCFLIPYTAKPGHYEDFYLSVYPGSAKISLTPLHYCGLSREPKSASVTLTPGGEGQRVDFTVSVACDVHVLLHQEKVTDQLAMVRGDAIAQDDVMMTAFNDQATKLASSGDPTNAREHSLAFKADKPGYYSLLLTSPNQAVSGDNPCIVSIFTPKRVMVRFVAPPVGARPLQQKYLPKLSRSGPAASAGTKLHQPRVPPAASKSRRGQDDGKLPSLRNNGASAMNPGTASQHGRQPCNW
ncbi:calpain-like cysteine peptidase, putative [Leishmania tarentolae]|uniref:Calpain-like cysteine peptidase, putative n=1 Tax=Leishmania tarentolae TaxID=5689 RepID=A0A640KKY9_LEITA|nr:calpain-like cysteine peptidase, putative [Leishmania tarentolae]